MADFDDVIIGDVGEFTPPADTIIKDSDKADDTPINLTAELQTELLGKFGTKYSATKVSENGDLLNDKGEVIKKYDDLINELEEEETTITINNIKYKIDANGNAIDDTGKIIKSKDEVSDLKKPMAQLISEKAGFVLKDEQGNPLSFSDDVDGLVDYTKALTSHIRKETYSTAVTDYFSSNPELIAAHNYYVQNKTLKGFSNIDIDYSKVTLDKDNIDTHIDWIVKAEMVKGNSEERAKQIANYIKNDNRTFEEAESAINYLKEKTDVNNKALLDETQNKINSELAAEEKLKTTIKTLLTSKKVKDLTLPDKFKVVRNGKEVELGTNDVLDAMFTPKYKDKDGNVYTEIEKRLFEIERNPEEYLLYNLQLLLGMNLNQVVKQNVQTTVATNLLDKMRAFKAKSKSAPIKSGNNDVVIDY